MVDILVLQRQNKSREIRCVYCTIPSCILQARGQRRGVLGISKNTIAASKRDGLILSDRSRRENGTATVADPERTYIANRATYREDEILKRTYFYSVYLPLIKGRGLRIPPPLKQDPRRSSGQDVIRPRGQCLITTPVANLLDCTI